jgi:hypothetical protein
MKRKKTVESDKAKIVAVIKELDQKKKEALRKAWEQVNKDFGSIFSMLLPGAQGCLQPPEGMNVLDGLEVRNWYSISPHLLVVIVDVSDHLENVTDDDYYYLFLSPSTSS